MASDADIAVWEALTVQVLESRLDGLIAGLSSSGIGLVLKHTMPVPSVMLPCLLLLFMICFLTFPRSRREEHTRTRATLQALLTIVAPTCSFWPSRYIRLAGVLCSRVNIPIEMIIEDTIDGVVELCNPIDDLPDLIGPGKTVNGHTIRINIGWRWWIKCFEWILAESKPGWSQWMRDNTLALIPLALSSSSSALTPSSSNPLICLDTLPHGTIPSLNPGCNATLEFTAFSPSLQMLGKAQIISAVLFITCERSRRRPRSLISVLQQLSASYGPNLIVDSISNASVDYERALRHVYESSLKEPVMRELEKGVKGWRRDVFRVALEVALVRLGWIERWIVQVTVK